MLKKSMLLGFVALLGLIAIEACSDSDSTPSGAETAGGGGQANAAGGRSAGAGQAGSAPIVAGATNESAGHGGESASDAGAAGSSETAAGNAGSDTGGYAGTPTSGGTGGTGGVLTSGGAGGHSGMPTTGGAGGTGGATNGATTFTLQTTTLGQVIGTAGGLSLYVFKPDTAGTAQTAPVSTCTGGCLTTWPIYYGTPVSVPTGLLASDFGSFDRGGGVLQSTYKGWPLYTFSGDAKAGDVNGEGINAKWYSVKLPFSGPGATTFTLQTTTLGQVIGTAGGLSLYVFKPDTAGTGQTAPVSACTGGCLTTWPIYYGTPVSVPTGLLASDFGSFDRGGGVLQSTYKGWPLYTFSGDAKATDVNGEGINAKWYSAKSPFVAPL